MKGFSILCIFVYVGAVLGKGFPDIPPSFGSIWPMPQMEFKQDGYMIIQRSNFTFSSVENDCEILQKAYQRYEFILNPEDIESTNKKYADYRYNVTESNVFVGQLDTLKVSLFNPCEEYPYLYMDEKYELQICSKDYPTEAVLLAQSVWGALRGLETFVQLALETSDTSELLVNCTQILDYPRFPHRGVLLDTGRHFLPVDVIQRNIDLMGMNKFNVFHWHIVDDQSFPYESAVYPNLSKEGSWSDIHVYSADDVQNVIEYARDWGIRVVVEFDTPGHVRSWGNGQPDLLTPCYTNDEPDGTYGPIDPTKEDNYIFLENIFTEISQRFPDHYLHLGGDEVNVGCWESNPAINDFMDDLNISGDYSKLEDYYIQKLIVIISNLPTKNGYVVWQEVFDNGVNIASDTVVHVWKYQNNPALFYPELAQVTAAGFQAILSSCWYLNYISYGVDWHKYYECDPHGFDGTLEQKQLVLGGEAAMWGEWVDKTNIISRTWPRAAPVAERLWSPIELTTDTSAAAPRLEEHRCRLLKRGYPVAPLGPSYCEGEL